MLFKKIDELHKTIAETPQLEHAKKFKVLLNIIETYVNERYIFNLPGETMESLLQVLERLLTQKGEFKPQDFQEIKELGEYIKSSQNIEIDVSEHMKLAGLQFPSYKTQTRSSCTQMNEMFAQCLESFSKIIKIENQMVENARIYTLNPTGVEERPELSQEGNNKQLHDDINQLSQIIHQQIQEASYLLRFNKFTSQQLQILTSMLQIIDIRKKQEIQSNELDHFAPLLMNSIEQLEQSNPEHPRVKLIKRATDEFVSKHYKVSDCIRTQREIKLELMDFRQSIVQEENPKNEDDSNSIFDLD